MNTASHLQYAEALARANARQKIGAAAIAIGQRSPAHILSAATRKDRERERRNATTNAMRASLGLEGRL